VTPPPPPPPPPLPLLTPPPALQPLDIMWESFSICKVFDAKQAP